MPAMQEKVCSKIPEMVSVRLLLSHWHPGVCSDSGDGDDAACIKEYPSEAGLTLVPLGMHAPMMALVRLPDNISGGREHEKLLLMPRKFRTSSRVTRLRYQTNM